MFATLDGEHFLYAFNTIFGSFERPENITAPNQTPPRTAIPQYDAIKVENQNHSRMRRKVALGVQFLRHAGIIRELVEIFSKL